MGEMTARSDICFIFKKHDTRVFFLRVASRESNPYERAENLADLLRPALGADWTLDYELEVPSRFTPEAPPE